MKRKKATISIDAIFNHKCSPFFFLHFIHEACNFSHFKRKKQCYMQIFDVDSSSEAAVSLSTHFITKRAARRWNRIRRPVSSNRSHFSALRNWQLVRSRALWHLANDMHTLWMSLFWITRESSSCSLISVRASSLSSNQTKMATSKRTFTAAESSFNKHSTCMAFVQIHVLFNSHSGWPDDLACELALFQSIFRNHGSFFLFVLFCAFWLESLVPLRTRSFFSCLLSF